MNYGADPKELARRVRREIMRREQAAAFAVSGNRRSQWADVLHDIADITTDPKISPIKIVKKLNAYFDQFDRIPEADRAYMTVRHDDKSKRNFSGWLQTVSADNHPLVNAETSLVVRSTVFRIGRTDGYARDSILGAMSTHCLARIQERTSLSVNELLVALQMTGLMAMGLTMNVPRGRIDHEIMIRFNDTILSGAVRSIGDPRGHYANQMIDYRTALDANTVTEEQLLRANTAGIMAWQLLHGEIDLTDVKLELPPARDDFINQNAQLITKRDAS